MAPPRSASRPPSSRSRSRHADHQVHPPRLSARRELPACTGTLQGKSYLDIQVKFAPVGGSVSAIAEGRAKSEKELRDMVMSILISALPIPETAP